MVAGRDRKSAGSDMGLAAVDEGAGAADGMKLFPYFQDSVRNRDAQQPVKEEMAAKTPPNEMRRGVSWVAPPQAAAAWSLRRPLA